MLNHLYKWEDKSWVGVPDKAPLQALAAALKMHTAPTRFETPEREEESEKEGCTGAQYLAREGNRKAVAAQISFNISAELKLRGVKLSSLTQAVAYNAIKEMKAKPFWPATDNNVKLVQSATKQNFNRLPCPAEIWKSIRHKDFTYQIRNFLRKSMHNAHRIGNFWKHIPECKDCEICQFCGETESLEHNLLECERPGQRQIWALAKELWLKKHPTWPDLSLGAIPGCGLASTPSNPHVASSYERLANYVPPKN
ncbi:hypothetical protein B0H13DRAFT_1865760 [Mycena leptocephala]|nr:hypothetical protein B0H13DRAFT_1865760 [Mycena leptocephala]